MADRGGLRRVVQAGSCYEIAHEVGRGLRRTFDLPEPAPEQVRLAWECEAILRGAYPALLGQFEGLLDGSQFDRDAFAAYYFARDRRVFRAKCTMFALAPESTADGRLWVGRNFDWVLGDLEWCELRETRITGAPARLGYSNHWIGCPDVLTERGLLIALATLRPHPIERPGLQWNALIDLAAATCDTVDQAAHALMELPHIRAMHYLIADAQGRAAIVEGTPDGVCRHDLTDGFLLATNRPLSRPDDLAGCARYCGAEQRLAAAGRPAGPDEMKAVLRDHDSHICDGNHDADSPTSWATIWSFVSAPSERSMAIAPGRPCVHEYIPMSIRDGTLRWL